MFMHPPTSLSLRFAPRRGSESELFFTDKPRHLGFWAAAPRPIMSDSRFHHYTKQQIILNLNCF